ncbi:MAG TPA: DUF4412 domain-containing protein [Candidatus Binataceae bacterium]
MKKFTALLGSALTFALLSAPAIAGVVITQQINKSGGLTSAANAAGPTEQTVMVQDGKQKMVGEKTTTIIDADKSTMYVLNPAAKNYFQFNFPAGKATTLAASANSAVNFKKTGKTRTVAGYKCTEYTGAGHVMRGDYTVTECFSTDAPGAAEFAAYEKLMREKVKGTNMEMGGAIPDGIPLESDSTMKMGNVSIPGMTAEQTAQFQKMVANRPPTVIKTLVTKVVEQKLSADTFEVPKDYTKKEIPSMAGGSLTPAPAAQGSASAPPPAAQGAASASPSAAH